MQRRFTRAWSRTHSDFRSGRPPADFVVQLSFGIVGSSCSFVGVWLGFRVSYHVEGCMLQESSKLGRSRQDTPRSLTLLRASGPQDWDLGF